MSSFQEFLASKRMVSSLYESVADNSAPDLPGYVYLDRYWIAIENWQGIGGAEFPLMWTTFDNRTPSSTNIATIEALLWKQYAEGEEG